MDEEMDDTVMLTFTAVEIDLDYEFDAARYFDFGREESQAEARESELWFESMGSYPPSPFVTKLVLREDILLENVTTSPKTKALENMALTEIDSAIGVAPVISAMDTGNGACEVINGTISADLKSCILPKFSQSHHISTGLSFYDHTTDSKSKRSTAKPSFPRTSTLMKPTASQLAKQNQARPVVHSRFLNMEKNGKSSNNSSALESQPAKRQKLEGGQLRKVADTNQQTDLVHKEPKKVNIDENSTHAKLRLTIPKEPALKTAHRAQRLRPKVSREHEQLTSAVPTFRALPLNRKILEAPSFLLPKRSTPHLPEFQEFHLKTSERAMQHNSMVPSSIDHCSSSKVLHQPRAGSIAESSHRDPQRPYVLGAPKQEGCETIQKFKALPFNKKIFSSKGDIGVFRNSKREPTVPMEFNFHTVRRVQNDPPIELFNKLTLTSELQPSTGTRSQLKLPRATCGFAKGSKENRLESSFEQQIEVKNLVQEKLPKFKLKQMPSLAGVTKVGALSSMSRRSSGIR